MTNKANQTTEPKEVTIHELVAAFEGKHVEIIPNDHYGISITMTRAAIEYEDDKSELWFVERDSENKVTNSICIDEKSIESIEAYGDGSYTLNFSLCMTSVSISEYKTLEGIKRKDARQILKNGILDMSIKKLIQMSQYGLMGNVVLSNKVVFVENAFNHIIYDEKSNAITFSVEETQVSYGEISFSLDAIVEISGCEDKENPDEYLNVNIDLENDSAITIRILY